MKKYFVILALLITLTACTAENNTVSDSVSVSYDNQNTDFARIENESTFLNLDGSFKPLKEALLPSTFPEPCEDYQYPLTITGKGSLYGAVESEITINADSYNVEIVIDGNSTEFYAESFQGADIVDLDTGDDYCELAVYSAGPSMDPTVDFIRYDGEKLIPLVWHDESGYSSPEIYGYYDADEKDILPTFGAIWTDGKGRIVTSFDNAAFTDKRIALRYLRLEGNNWTEKILEKLSPLSCEFTVSEDFDAFFTPCDAAPASFDNDEFMKNFNFDNMTSFKKGQKIKLIDYGEIYNYYAFYVEIDGEKGVLAFWLGD